MADLDDLATHFLNADLDVWSVFDLQPLVDALEKKIEVNHNYPGEEGNCYGAHFALAHVIRGPRSKRQGGHSHRTKDFDATADRLLFKLCDIIDTLPSQARELWDRAETREFNTGVQGGNAPKFLEIPLRPETLHRVATLQARIVLTIYASTPAEPKSKQK